MEVFPPSNADGEECSSSESGWTTYLTSPNHGGSNSDGFDDGDGEVDGPSSRNRNSGGCGDEEDDSMASDASSGSPDQQRRRHGMCEGKEKISHCCSKCCEENQKVEEVESKLNSTKK